MQTTTPRQFASFPDKKALAAEYVGKPLQALRTPAFVIDRAVFAKNCARMHESAKQWGADFRAHIKTHKVRRTVLFSSRMSNDSDADIGRDEAAISFRVKQDRINRRFNDDGGMVSCRWWACG